MMVEVFADQADVLGEGPIWSVADQALCWLDIAQRRVYRRAPGERRSHVTLVNDYPGCIAEISKGCLAVAMRDGLQRLSLDSGATELLCKAEGRRPGTRFNDGKVDARGRFWVGTMQNNFGPQGEGIAVDRNDGTLFRFGPGGSCEALEEDIGVPNTLAWSPDERLFYFADSIHGAIFVYDYDAEAGRLANKREHFAGSDLGIPDGSAIDVDGCLWNARWDGAAIIRITPNGTVDRKISLPVPRPTSCIFGGPKFDTLYVTSASQGLTDDQLEHFPLSGSVFAIDGVAQGLPVPAFRQHNSDGLIRQKPQRGAG